MVVTLDRIQKEGLMLDICGRRGYIRPRIMCTKTYCTKKPLVDVRNSRESFAYGEKVHSKTLLLTC